MDRLEEIKERLSYFPHELQDGGFSENSLEYGARLDIEYLLQRLERYEKALSKIAFGRIEGGFSDVKYYAREALNDEIT